MNPGHIQPIQHSNFNKKPKKQKMKMMQPTTAILFSLVIILVGAVGVLGYLYFDQRQQNAQVLGQQEQVQEQSQEYQEILDAINSLVDIDSEERVNVARIDKPEDLIAQNPTFYNGVQAGQYLVVFPTSQRVMVFDKEANKIVNFSSYSIKVELIPEDEISESEKPLEIELRYTSNVTEETVDQVVATLEEASENYIITETNETFLTYDEPLSVYLLNRTAKPKMSQNLVAHVGSREVNETLPSGESSSTADAVVILTTNGAGN